MNDDTGRANKPGTNEAKSAPPRHPERGEDGGEVNAMREQAAIAAAKLVGEQLRREDRNVTYFYAKRVGGSVSVLGLAGMLMLFAYARMAGGDFSPTLGMLGLAFLVAAGASVAYWAYVESKRSRED